MTVYDLWTAVSSAKYCESSNCTDCKKLYGLKTCPSNLYVDKNSINDFIVRITKRLREFPDGLPFELDENDLVKILTETVTE